MPSVLQNRDIMLRATSQGLALESRSDHEVIPWTGRTYNSVKRRTGTKSKIMTKTNDQHKRFELVAALKSKRIRFLVGHSHRPRPSPSI